MSWRSPARVPPLIDSTSVQPPTEPLPRLAIGAAWRLRALAHALAHGLRRVPPREHRLVAQRIDALLGASDAFAATPAAGGEPDAIDRVVQARIDSEPLPACESWAEVALADVLFGGALEATLVPLAASSDAPIAAAARLARGEPFGDPAMDDMASDERNRWCLQLLVDRWGAACVMTFGRPGSPGDAELVRSRVKPASSADLLASWLASIERRMEPWGLALPDAQLMGVDVPGDWTPSRRARRPPAG